MNLDDDLDFDDDDSDTPDYENDPTLKVKLQKIAAQRKREINDRLEMLKWKREYGLSDEDFQALLNDR